MTEHDVNVARDIGSLQADMRTVKHDVAGVSSKIDGLSMQISNLAQGQSRGLGFFAGASAVLTLCGAFIIAAFKYAFGQHSG